QGRHPESRFRSPLRRNEVLRSAGVVAEGHPVPAQFHGRLPADKAAHTAQPVDVTPPRFELRHPPPPLSRFPGTRAPACWPARRTCAAGAGLDMAVALTPP